MSTSQPPHIRHTASSSTRLTVSLLYIFVSVSGAWVSPADARITRIEITTVESPTADGKRFGAVGAYEKLRGKAYGEVDPQAPRNAVITDIALAPRNSDGMVEYSMDVYILKPVDLDRGNRTLFLEVNNRGNKLFGRLNDAPRINDPTTAADLGNGFLMDRGYTLVWNGWDISADTGNDRLTITVPIARNADGSVIEGPSYEYINIDSNDTTTYRLAYPAVTVNADDDRRLSTLTVKQLLNDTPMPLGPDEWEFVDERTIRLLPAGTPFKQSHIYELTYTARDPLVAGLGLAATRDFMSFLRHAEHDDFGTRNPLAGDVRSTLAWTMSQPGRYLNDFQTLGFNQDENGQRVLDGIENWIAGSGGVGINYRFAHTYRTERNRQHHFYPEGIFPFAYPELSDPVSGKTAGRSGRCLASGTCAKVFEVNSANEYWAKASSLLHTDPAGRDLADPNHVRFFLIAGAQHGRGDLRAKGPCQQFQNPTDAAPALRALLVALDEWVTQNVTPPDSRVPRVADGTAVFSVPQPGSVTGIVPQSDLGFPDIPGLTYTGLTTTRYLFDFGSQFDEGRVNHYPPAFEGQPTYPSFVSKTDQDGNEIAGIRLPPVAAPVATTTGWALRREGYGLGDGCESAGQYVPFATTRDERLASGDPRLSLEERYETHQAYVEAVSRAARQLQQERLLLDEDVDRYIQEAENRAILD
jgi:hypothetical protein